MPSSLQHLLNPDEAGSSDEDEIAPAPAAEEPKKKPPRVKKTNHLGVPLLPNSRRRIRYQQTFTIVYDAHTQSSLERDDQGRVYRLLQDTRAVIDHSVDGLRHLFHRD